MIEQIPAWRLVGGLLDLNRALGKMAFGGGLHLPDDHPANTAALDAYGAQLRDSLASMRTAGGEDASPA